MKATSRTWLLVLLAMVLSGIIAWFETRDRTRASGAPAAESGDAGDTGDDYTVDVELVQPSD